MFYIVVSTSTLTSNSKLTIIMQIQQLEIDKQLMKKWR